MSSALIHKYGDNGMFGFKLIPTNNECGVRSLEDCSEVQGSRLKVERRNIMSNIINDSLKNNKEENHG